MSRAQVELSEEDGGKIVRNTGRKGEKGSEPTKRRDPFNVGFLKKASWWWEPRTGPDRWFGFEFTEIAQGLRAHISLPL